MDADIHHLNRDSHVHILILQSKQMLWYSIDISTAYHPETDAQSERTIQTLEDMLRVWHPFEHFKVESVEHCLLAEVWRVQLHRTEIINETIKKIVQIRQRLQAARDRQRSYANIRRRPLEFQVGDRVMLKVSPRKGVIRFEKRRKAFIPVMSSSTHPIIILSDSDVKDAFSSTNTPNYTLASLDYSPASPGNTSSDPSEDSSKDRSASLSISPFHDDPYMKA
ncbi:putative reverse transcriptase domain-containing protein [Tanacetum coccineum]